MTIGQGTGRPAGGGAVPDGRPSGSGRPADTAASAQKPVEMTRSDALIPPTSGDSPPVREAMSSVVSRETSTPTPPRRDWRSSRSSEEWTPPRVRPACTGGEAGRAVVSCQSRRCHRRIEGYGCRTAVISVPTLRAVAGADRVKPGRDRVRRVAGERVQASPGGGPGAGSGFGAIHRPVADLCGRPQRANRLPGAYRSCSGRYVSRETTPPLGCTEVANRGEPRARGRMRSAAIDASLAGPTRPAYRTGVADRP